MSKSVNISKYPPGMMDLLEAVCETRKPADLAFVDKKTALRERFNFYGLIRAIKVSGHSLAAGVNQLEFTLTGPHQNNLHVRYIGADEANSPMSALYAQAAEKLLKNNP